MAVQGAVITSVAVSPDGRYVLSGGSDKDVHLWKLPRPIRAT
nr:WD40 repeat domain-containing protein [Candidatus Freyarchaeota archaeon]